MTAWDSVSPPLLRGRGWGPLHPDERRPWTGTGQPSRTGHLIKTKTLSKRVIKTSSNLDTFLQDISKGWNSNFHQTTIGKWYSEIRLVCFNAVDPYPDWIRIPWGPYIRIRIQEGKNDLKKWKKVNTFHIFKCWMFSFEGWILLL